LWQSLFGNDRGVPLHGAPMGFDSQKVLTPGLTGVTFQRLSAIGTYFGSATHPRRPEPQAVICNARPHAFVHNLFDADVHGISDVGRKRSTATIRPHR
jgi:hypothetical protein